MLTLSFLLAFLLSAVGIIEHRGHLRPGPRLQRSRTAICPAQSIRIGVPLALSPIDKRIGIKKA